MFSILVRHAMAAGAAYAIALAAKAGVVLAPEQANALMIAAYAAVEKLLKPVFGHK